MKMLRRAAQLAAFGSTAGLGAYWLWHYLRPERSTLVLNKCVVLITGASSGVGRAFANAFARRGARLVLTARREDLLEAVRAEVAPYAADVLTLPGDVSDPEHLHRVIAATTSRFGPVEILVNNAGGVPDGQFQRETPDSIARALRTDLEAALVLTNLCLPSMLAQRAGWILNVGSAAARAAAPFQPVNNAAKAGLLTFSRALARQLDGTGVEVYTALPAYVYSDMLRPAAERWARALGVTVDTPDFVAEQAIAAMLKGQHEIIFGGGPVRALLFVERHFPALADLLWRALLSPDAIAAHAHD